MHAFAGSLASTVCRLLFDSAQRSCVIQRKCCCLGHSAALTLGSGLLAAGLGARAGAAFFSAACTGYVKATLAFGTADLMQIGPLDVLADAAFRQWPAQWMICIKAVPAPPLPPSLTFRAGEALAASCFFSAGCFYLGQGSSEWWSVCGRSAWLHRQIGWIVIAGKSGLPWWPDPCQRPRPLPQRASQGGRRQRGSGCTVQAALFAMGAVSSHS
jgi:hypothetical protein